MYGTAHTSYLIIISNIQTERSSPSFISNRIKSNRIDKALKGEGEGGCDRKGISMEYSEYSLRTGCSAVVVATISSGGGGLIRNVGIDHPFIIPGYAGLANIESLTD